MRFKHWFFIILIKNIPVIDGLDKAFPYIKRGGAYMQIGLFDKAKADFDFALANCMDVNKSPNCT